VTALNSLRDPFNPELLAAMKQAFDATWAVIQAQRPSLDKERANALSLDMSRKIVALAAEGVTDSLDLRRRMLESLPLLRTE
jgi:hypothetical protein